MAKTKFQSIVTLTCPRCREGDMFVKPGLFIFRKPLNMHEKCSKCDLKFEIEQGFWYGALWTSYPLVLMVELPFLLMAVFGVMKSPWFFFGIIIIAFIVLFPAFMRLGRSIWIHIWVKYKPDYKKELK